MRFVSRYLFALAALSSSTLASANAGVTSTGVTTTDPNSASTDVQQQSSGFVAANQQLQNGVTTGIALPGGTVAGTAGVSGSTQAGAKGSAGVNADQAAAADAKNGGAPATPPAPPLPPPTYVSNMRPVNRAADAPPPPPPAESHPAPKAVANPATPKPAAPTVVTAAKPARAPAKNSDAVPELPLVTDPGGGRGATPDGYTFWFGLLIAGALIALAALTYLRIQHGETSR